MSALSCIISLTAPISTRRDENQKNKASPMLHFVYTFSLRLVMQDAGGD